MGKRRESRELALELLFMIDIVEENADDAVENYLQSQKILPSVKEFAVKLKDGVIKYKENLDKIISKTAENWEISRMPVIDRNILRIAVFEFLYLKEKESSIKIIINEAIEVAKEYSTEESGSFVNGILDKIVKSSIGNDNKEIN
ncbi:MAG: transcription antitermination factor NusB [bacterium]|nr:transcription antitermination factor NusB [bacterium]